VAVDDAGYAGPIEVEIFNPEIWSRPGDKILATMKERYAALVRYAIWPTMSRSQMTDTRYRRASAD
jgi:hypothetical protein